MHRAKSIKISFFIPLLLAMMVTLSHCHYHLRGNTPLDQHYALTRIAFHSQQPHSHFIKTLQNTLVRMGGQWQSEKNADLIVELQQIDLAQTARAVSSNTQIHSVNLHFRVTYQVHNAKGTVLVPSKTITVTKIFNSDDNQMLGASHEKWQIELAMHQELSYQLLNQLRAFTAVNHHAD